MSKKGRISEQKFRILLKIIIIILMGYYVFDIYTIILQDIGNKSYLPCVGVILDMHSEKLAKDFWNPQYYTPIVSYEYEYKGEKLAGHRLSMISDKMMLKSGEMDDFLSKYKKGKIITIWVDPNNHESSFLVRYYYFGPYARILVFTPFLCGLIWYFFKPDEENPKRFIECIGLNVFLAFTGLFCYGHYLSRDNVSVTFSIILGAMFYFALIGFFTYATFYGRRKFLSRNKNT